MSVVLIFNLLVWSAYYDIQSPELEIYFLDIGQGDSILIKSPDNYYMLVDAGPDSEVLSKLGEIMPFWNKKIDIILATHPDLDHIGGFPEVIRYFDIGHVIYTKKKHKSYVYEEFERIIVEKNIPEMGFREGNDFRLGCCVYINILFPFEDTDIEKLGSNEASIALELIYKDINIFMGGDLDQESEEELVFRDSWLDTDILKAGHHGSKTSSSELFISKITPEVAIISAGRDNRFGHPHEDVLSIMGKNGVRVYSTNELETIKVRSDGKEYWVE